MLQHSLVGCAWLCACGGLNSEQLRLLGSTGARSSRWHSASSKANSRHRSQKAKDSWGRERERGSLRAGSITWKCSDSEASTQKGGCCLALMVAKIKLCCCSAAVVGGSVGPLHVSPAAWAVCTVGRGRMKFSSPHTGSKYFHWEKKKTDQVPGEGWAFFLWSRKYPENLQSTHVAKYFCSHLPHQQSPLPCTCWEREDTTQW